MELTTYSFNYPINSSEGSLNVNKLEIRLNSLANGEKSTMGN